MSDLWWIVAFVQWFRSPTIPPWLGAIVVTAAAFGVMVGAEPTLLVKSPFASATRAIATAAVWLALVWLCITASGSGSNGSLYPETDPVIIIGTPANRMPEHVSVAIRFVASVASHDEALEYACEIDDRVKRVLIRAPNHTLFYRQLDERLREVKLPTPPAFPTIQIQRSPYPGESVLHHISESVLHVIPGAAIEFSE